MKNTFLSCFTPSLMTAETLEAIFVQHHKLADYLVELIQESTLTKSKHFRLLIGPRGIGKTHIIALIYHRISKMEDLRDKLLIAWMREEEWGISSFLDLLLRIFRALEKEYPDEYEAKLNQSIEELYQLSPDEAQFKAEDLLREFVGERTLLLLMENLDDVFDGLGDIGQKQLRSYIQNYSFLTILATAQSLFNAVKQYNEPFYGFFGVHLLEELTLDEAVDLLTQIAQLEGDSELESFIQSPTGRDRIQTIHHLAGGNPRIYVIFAEFLNRKALEELVTPFMKTLDELTPYYQVRMQWLSPQQRKIVELLCDRRHPIPVREIAQRCFITHQTASGQLKDLRKKGYVKSDEIGRESFYDLREPLMRFCLEVKKQRGEPIELIVEFLGSWYTALELVEQLELVLHDAMKRMYIIEALRISIREYIKLLEQLLDHSNKAQAYIEEMEAYIKKYDFFQALKISEKLIEVAPSSRYSSSVCIRGMLLSILNHSDEALASFNQVVELEPNNASAWQNRGIELKALKRYNKALESYDKAIKINPNDSSAWSNRGTILGILERYDEALTSLDKAIELNPDGASHWLYRGLILKSLERYDESLDSINKATQLDREPSYSYFHLAGALIDLNRWQEGIIALDNGLNNFPHDDKLAILYTTSIVGNLFSCTYDSTIWKERITNLTEIYDKHKIALILRTGIVRNISALMSEMVSDTAARKWVETWQELVGERKEFQIPLRLLNAAVKYRETKGDKRVLLELPIEERKVLEQILELEQSI